MSISDPAATALSIFGNRSWKGTVSNAISTYDHLPPSILWNSSRISFQALICASSVIASSFRTTFGFCATRNSGEAAESCDGDACAGVSTPANRDATTTTTSRTVSPAHIRAHIASISLLLWLSVKPALSGSPPFFCSNPGGLLALRHGGQPPRHVGQTKGVGALEGLVQIFRHRPESPQRAGHASRDDRYGIGVIADVHAADDRLHWIASRGDEDADRCGNGFGDVRAAADVGVDLLDRLDQVASACRERDCGLHTPDDRGPGHDTAFPAPDLLAPPRAPKCRLHDAVDVGVGREGAGDARCDRGCAGDGQLGGVRGQTHRDRVADRALEIAGMREAGGRATHRGAGGGAAAGQPPLPAHHARIGAFAQLLNRGPRRRSREPPERLRIVRPLQQLLHDALDGERPLALDDGLRHPHHLSGVVGDLPGLAAAGKRAVRRRLPEVADGPTAEGDDLAEAALLGGGAHRVADRAGGQTAEDTVVEIDHVCAPM